MKMIIRLFFLAQQRMVAAPQQHTNHPALFHSNLRFPAPVSQTTVSNFSNSHNRSIHNTMQSFLYHRHKQQRTSFHSFPYYINTHKIHTLYLDPNTNKKNKKVTKKNDINKKITHNCQYKYKYCTIHYFIHFNYTTSFSALDPFNSYCVSHCLIVYVVVPHMS